MSKKVVLKKLTQDEKENSRGGWMYLGPPTAENDPCEDYCKDYCVSKPNENSFSKESSMYDGNFVYRK